MFNFIAWLNSLNFLLIAQICSLAFKAFIFASLLHVSTRFEAGKKIIILFFGVIFGSIVSDAAWIFEFSKRLFPIAANYRLAVSVSCFAWAFYIIQYQCLALFLEYLMTKHLTLGKRHWLFLSLSIVQCLVYLCSITILSPLLVSRVYLNEHYPFIVTLLNFCFKLGVPYVFTVIGFSTQIILRKLLDNSLPSILNEQLKIFITLFILPNLMFEFVTYLPFIEFIFGDKANALYFPIASISTLLVTMALFFCYRRILGLRFLNHKDHIEAPVKSAFIDDYKQIIDRISKVTDADELTYITQYFFDKAFSIPMSATQLHLRESLSNDPDYRKRLTEKERTVEKFLMLRDKPDSAIRKYLDDTKIFIKDELEFTNFYAEDEAQASVLAFINTIGASIFLPIYDQGSIHSYIIISANEHPPRLFNDVERSGMLIFAKHLGHISGNLRQANYMLLLQKEKALKEELYRNQQELDHYKESTRSFLRSSIERKFGLLYFKRDYFTILNEAARELIGFDINKNHKHPLHIALQELAQKVLYCKSPQATTKEGNAGKLMLSAMQIPETAGVVIGIYYPDVSETLKQQLDSFKHQPPRHDYLLYLETTQMGKLINELVPGNGPEILYFKTELISATLSGKATLLSMNGDDVMAAVEILHGISGRELLDTLKLTEYEKNNEVQVRLFGRNSLYGKQTEDDQMVQKLDAKGTLFIQNIEYVSLQTQKCLAEFITYGYYQRFKSEQKLFSDVRIICSTEKNLRPLVAENVFSKELYAILQEMNVSMPSLLTLPKDEFFSLAHGVMNKSLKPEKYTNLESFDDQEKHKLLEKRCYSLQELNKKIQTIIAQRPSKHARQREIKPASKFTKSDLNDIAILGAKALRDPEIMKLLWQTFKSQSRIAEFLGVNRSSVYKRCKEYKLTNELGHHTVTV